jgi:hypothetical protein
MRMDLGGRAQTLMDMRVSQAAEYKFVKEQYEMLMKYAL